MYALQNKAKAHIYGLSVNASLQIMPKLNVEGVVNITRGQFTDAVNGRIPLDHVPPTHGRFALKKSGEKWNAELFVLFNVLS